MQIDESVLTLSGFRQELSNLNHLLSGTLTPSFSISAFDAVDQPVPPFDPRQAKICSQILPWNRFFKEYAQEARRLLGLPPDGIEPCDETNHFENLKSALVLQPGCTSYLWATWWAAIHSRKAGLPEGATFGRLPPFLPQWLHQYAENEPVVAIPESQWPEWTSLPPRFPTFGQPPTSSAPLDLITALLLSTFGLPARLFDPVRWFLLTGDGIFLRKGSNPLEVFDVQAKVGTEGKPSFTMMVAGLDTSTTKEDWVEIWDQQLAPQLDRQLVNEGQLERAQEGKPMLSGEDLELALFQGRRKHHSGLRLAQYAPFYDFYHQHHQDDLEDTLAKYLDCHPEDPVLKGGSIELKTLKTNLEGLERLMTPRK